MRGGRGAARPATGPAGEAASSARSQPAAAAGPSGLGRRLSCRPGGPSSVCWGCPRTLGTAVRRRAPPAAATCDSLSQTWPHVVRHVTASVRRGRRWSDGRLEIQPGAEVASQLRGSRAGAGPAVLCDPLPTAVWVWALPWFPGLGLSPSRSQSSVTSHSSAP